MDRFDPVRLDAREAIARYADGKLIARLAPLVEWVADRIDRPASPRDAIPRAPSQGQVRLEPVTRKVLAFDDSPKVWLAGVALVVLLVVWPEASGEYTPLTTDRAQTWVLVSIRCVMVCVGFIICVYGMALRLRTLRRLLATCVVVPSRMTDDRWDGDGLSMTFEYSYAGTAYQYKVTYSLREQALICDTPEPPGVHLLPGERIDPGLLHLTMPASMEPGRGPL